MAEQAESGALLAQSRHALLSGDFARVFELARQAEHAPGLADGARAQALVQAAMAAWNSGDAAGGMNWAERALPLARAGGDPHAAVQAVALKGACLALAGRVGEAVAALREAVATVSPTMATSVRHTVYTAVGVSHRQLGPSAFELAAAREVVQTLEPHAPPAGIVRSWCNLANAAEERWRDLEPVDPGAAQQLLADVLSPLPQLQELAGDHPHARATLHAVYGGLLLAAGRLHEARAFLRDALHETASLHSTSDGWQERVALLAALARCERLLGDAEASAQALDEARPLVEAHRDAPHWPWLLRRLADVAELEGDAAGVRHWSNRYLARVLLNAQHAIDAEVATLAVGVNQHVLTRELQQLQELAHRDALTGLLNRRGTEQAFAALAAQCLVLGLVDLDHFKRINDEHGHPVGDEVLRVLARLLGSTLRHADRVGRHGGEEFVLLLADFDPAGAEAYARRLEQAVRGHVCDTAAGPIRITLSGGLVAVRAGEPFEAAVARADALLYRAKQAGRDRIVVAPEAV